MTTHLREQILNAIKTTITGLPTIGNNVFRDHTRPFTDIELPGTDITFSDEPTQYLNSVWGSARRDQMRTLTVLLRHVVKINAIPSTTLNAMCLECEKSLIDRTLGGLSVDLRLVHTGKMETSPNAEQLVGELTMIWEVDYTCIEGAPDTAH